MKNSVKFKKEKVERKKNGPIRGGLELDSIRIGGGLDKRRVRKDDREESRM